MKRINSTTIFRSLVIIGGISAGLACTLSFAKKTKNIIHDTQKTVIGTQKKTNPAESFIKTTDAEKINRHTKIVATVGPASSSPEVIRDLIKNGVNVFRLNFSHGDHASHQAVADIIRKEARAANKNSALLVDLQGPKLRIGTFKNGTANLEVGAKIILDLNTAPGDEKRVNFPHKEVYKSVVSGMIFYLDDGKLLLKAISATNNSIKLEVIKGGELSNRKGVGIRGMKLPVSVLTEKDLKDLTFALTLNPEWIALSFVQSPDDIDLLRSKLPNPETGIIAKIETSGALEKIDSIVKVSDAVMVARGDLSIDISPENLFDAQNVIVSSARKLGKPVIIATQMMESMITSPKPTNAEVTDVSYAVSNMADAVMLSAESASGKNPALTVQTMDAIIRQVENDQSYLDKIKNNLFNPQAFLGNRSFPVSMAQLATASNMKYIALKVGKGKRRAGSIELVKNIASARPLSFIIPVCENKNDKKLSALQLVWGVYPLADSLNLSPQDRRSLSDLMKSLEEKRTLLINTNDSENIDAKYSVNMLNCSDKKTNPAR